MAVYVKSKDGRMKTISNNLVKMYNDKWFECTRSVENGVEYYTVSSEIDKYIVNFSPNTLYALGFKEPNTTTNPKLRYKSYVLDIVDFTRDEEGLPPGRLNGVFQMFTQILDGNATIYFCGDTHKDEGIVDATVESINYDQKAEVSVSGIPGKATLNFKLPSGPPSLAVNNFEDFTNELAVGTQVYVRLIAFNRKPNRGELFTYVSHSKLLTLEVFEINTNMCSCLVVDMVDIKGDPILMVVCDFSSISSEEPIVGNYIEMGLGVFNRRPIRGEPFTVNYGNRLVGMVVAEIPIMGNSILGQVLYINNLAGSPAPATKDVLPITPKDRNDTGVIPTSIFISMPKIGDEFWALCKNNVFGKFTVIDFNVSAVRVRYDSGYSIINCCHPVGSIITTVDPAFRPHEYWVGTKWEMISDGVYLRSNHVIRKQRSYPLAQFSPPASPNILGQTSDYRANTIDINGNNSRFWGCFRASEDYRFRTEWRGDEKYSTRIDFNARFINSQIFRDNFPEVMPSSFPVIMWIRREDTWDNSRYLTEDWVFPKSDEA